jgi:hypothetical protein
MLTQIMMTIILYCNSSIPTATGKTAIKSWECRRELMDCALGESILPKDLKLIQCIKTRDAK